MSRLIQVYRFLNHLSVDVSAGAMAMAWFFCRVLHAPVATESILVLGLTVWLIYAVDHILDALRIAKNASTFRHRFYQRNFKILLPVILGAAIVDVTLIFMLDVPLIQAGTLLGICTILYLLIQHRLSYTKEFFGAVFYTAGVVMIAWVQVHADMHIMHYLLIAHFMLTAWINLLLFSLFDERHDEADRHVSFVIKWGRKKTSILISFLLLVCTGLTLAQWGSPLLWPAIIVMLMDIFFAGIFIFRKYFVKEDRFRLAGDAVFFFPLCYYFLQ